MTKFNKIKCLELLNYKKFVEEKFGVPFSEYNLEKDFELKNQLSYIEDFLIWRNSFSQYYNLFTNFKNKSIDGESFVDEFFELFDENKMLLENFVFDSKNVEKLNINPKSFGFKLLVLTISFECDEFESDPNSPLANKIDEDTLRSYIIKKFSLIDFYKKDSSVP